MQDRYVGDIGDFGKYGLLRALCGHSPDDEPKLKLGVVWYLVPEEERNADGKHTNYLMDGRDPHAYRDCDQELLEKLALLVSSSQRSVRAVREAGILPPGTVFHEEPLTFAQTDGGGRSGGDARATRRRIWLQHALDATSCADIVFLDPDNGLECKTVGPHSRRGPKFAYLEEMVSFFERGQSLVVYHHLNRTKPGSEQIAYRVNQLRDSLRLREAPFALAYHRGTARAFFVVPNSKDGEILSRRLKHLLASPWSRHFDRQGTRL
jgi:hypothetical protein